MWQRNMDSNDIYLDNFKADIQKVDIAKVNHTFYAQNIMEVRDTDNTMATEIYNDWEKFKSILFLRRSNEGR